MAPVLCLPSLHSVANRPVVTFVVTNRWVGEIERLNKINEAAFVPSLVRP